MATIFFSYSHIDEGLRDQLETHLYGLKRQGLISAWVFLTLCWLGSGGTRRCMVHCFELRADLLTSMPGIRMLAVLRDKDGVVVRAAGSGSRRCPDCGTR